MSTEPASAGSSARILSIVGAVLGAVSILFVPIILGPAGAVLGFIGYAKGDKPLGLYVGIGSLIAMVIGMALGVMVWNAEMN